MSEQVRQCSDAGCDKTSCENCSQANAAPDFSAPLHEMSTVKKVIGIVSGKGGVGKSVVTALLAAAMQKAGQKTAVLDADITGPSIPKAFGLHGKANATEIGLLPLQTASGIEIISTNLLLNNETDPVVWRGPIIAGTVKQFWSDVIWTDIDYMFIDMPPGTGDVPLTVFQSLPVDGIIIVTSPQELVSMIVGKAVKMASMMQIPILGLIENYSYFKCPDNGKEYQVFGPSHLQAAAADYGLEILARLPIDPALAAACDSGNIEHYQTDTLNDVIELLKNME
ncbi:Mrp/NBP35 family ATP-binding protein [uncultured Phascolarctobacterium sp.]|jgi:Mrp family chromosome partitioning ATPase|uniref:Mrp/NBP35 family ATP-binding protein n=1 Tax=uncultured Phascolarctobacterium sp. TaxID=512296 RepID=UPI00262C4F1C|nr:Mrp/NBP35 family ATP-binding protein [uncultured Phascolarctobacterium sp.]MDO5380703.1 Mrp/NBP35 family ATP-binding protein [Acidaminococcaceae bacterium]